jgi:hypothetical protein
MKELFTYLMANKITPNGLFALWTISEKVGYLNYINIVIELSKLERLNLITKIQCENNTCTYNITSKGRIILITAAKHMASAKKTNKVTMQEWESYIVTYNEMFPKGKKEGSAVGFRTNPKELLEKFSWFFEEYPEYSWENVLAATKSYTKEFEDKNDYTYMQTSKYFIKKEDKNRVVTSTLAQICYNISQGDDININNTGYHYFGPE